MNVGMHLENSAIEYPDKVAMRHEGRSLTFNELNKQCNKLCWGLNNKGLRAGDICALMMPNSLEFVVSYYALSKMGCIILPLNFLLKSHELQYLMSDSKPKAFIGMTPYLEEARYVLKKTKDVSIKLASGIGEDEDFGRLEDIYVNKGDYQIYPSKREDTLILLYTSGTTGIPKGVMLTHENLVSVCQICAKIVYSDPDAIVIGTLPLYHIYGQNRVLNTPIYLAQTVELLSRFDPEKVMDLIEEHEKTIFFGVPTMYHRLVEAASKRHLKRHSLKHCVSGGASLPVEIHERFEALFKAKIYEGYGLSESPLCISNPYGKLIKPGSIGIPIPQYQAKIVGEEGREVGFDEVGELAVKGPGVMKGYLNHPRETEESLKEGWFFTGDLARRDHDGYIYIVDRKKQVIIRGGYNVYPREIEELLYQLPEIQEACVFGIGDPDLGEEVAAAVVLKEEVKASKESIQEYVKNRVAPYKYPRVIKMLKSLPKGPLGKISKKELQKIFGNKS